MHRHPIPPMAAAILDLTARSFIATNTYGDGVIRMAKRLPNGDESVAWLTEAGMIRPPHLMSDYRATAHRRFARDLPVREVL